MTDTTIATLQESFAWLAESLPELTAQTFDGFFARAPELRKLFPADGAGHRRRFSEAISLIVGGLGDWPDTLGKIERLGRAHSHFGAGSEHFDALTAAFLAAIEMHLGSRYSPRVEIAWRELMVTIARIMVDAQEFGTWTAPLGERGNPFAPIMGVSVERYALIVNAIGSVDDMEISGSMLSAYGLDRQTWEAVRSGWNARLTDPTIGGIVAVAYVDAARSHGHETNDDRDLRKATP